MNAGTASTARGEQDHPAPHRHQTSGWLLWAGLMLAPAAWFTQLAIDYSLLSEACYPHDEPLTRSLSGVLPWVHGTDAVAVVLCVVAALLAWRSWHRTVREKPGGGQELMSSGDGRTRFMAMAGLVTTGLVGLAVANCTLTHLLLLECGT